MLKLESEQGKDHKKNGAYGEVILYSWGRGRSQNPG